MRYRSLNTGWIEVICGPMFAGKTEELIRRTTRLDYAKKKYVVFKPEIDNRYSINEIVSHSKYSTKAINITNPSEMLKYIKEDIDVIVIDEVQFFDKSLINIVTNLASEGKRVICAGLDCDFTGKPFGLIPDLLAIAEDITKLTAICTVCGEPATRTQRIVNGEPAYDDDPTILVGATESYEARCRACHEVRHRGK